TTVGDFRLSHVSAFKQFIREPQVLVISGQTVNAPQEINHLGIWQAFADDFITPKPNAPSQTWVPIVLPMSQQRVGIFTQPADRLRVAVIPAQIESGVPEQLAV